MTENNDKRCHIVVGICTYQRPKGLERLLQGLEKQSFSRTPQPDIEILIVDNEGNPESAHICDTFKVTTPAIPLTYLVEPRRGISHARNAVLEHVSPQCDFLAMIDDDEHPSPGWLDNLLATQRDTQAEIVRGPITPVFDEGTPEWVRQGEYFGWPGEQDTLVDGQEMRSASTSNTLVQWEGIQRLQLRFESALALTGGEDVVFFHQLRRNGCRIVYAADAGVEEHIPPTRTSLRALLRLGYRNGNNRLRKRLRLRSGNQRWATVILLAIEQFASSIRHITLGLLQILGFWLPGRNGPAEVCHGLIRAARGVGQLTGITGLTYRYYQ